MKVAIVGSRNITEYVCIELAMGELFDDLEITEKEVTAIISGGADTLAAEYAQKHHIELVEIKPLWEVYGRSAGFCRNQDIVDAADCVVALWDGCSKGTKDTVTKAQAAKKHVHIYLP